MTPRFFAPLSPQAPWKRQPLRPTRNGLLRRLPWLLWLAAGMPLLSACTGMLLPKPTPPAARLTLDSGAPPAAERAPTAATADAVVAADAPILLVDVPRAAPGYDSRHMVYVRQPPLLEAFALHEWVATPAQMLAPQLVRALQDSGAFRAVLAAPTTAAAGGWRLETELLRLHQDFSQPHQPSHIRLTLRAVLLNGTTRQAVAWREFDLNVPTTGEGPIFGALAAQVAAQQVARAVAAFCVERIQARAP